MAAGIRSPGGHTVPNELRRELNPGPSAHEVSLLPTELKRRPQQRPRHFWSDHVRITPILLGSLAKGAPPCAAALAETSCFFLLRLLVHTLALSHSHTLTYIMYIYIINILYIYIYIYIYIIYIYFTQVQVQLQAQAQVQVLVKYLLKLPARPVLILGPCRQIILDKYSHLIGAAILPFHS